jgi:hypothetical protein
MKVDDIPLSSLFILRVATPKPIGMLLRQDPNIGKHMVKLGSESPLRQSISCRELRVMEQNVENLHHQLLDEVENLKQQIEELEKETTLIVRGGNSLAAFCLYIAIQMDDRVLESN